MAIAALVAAAMLPAVASAQKETGGIIVGRVTDAETGGPVENVIIFIASTPIGTSTEKDGSFKISRISPGEYDLVLSCVGYDRQTVPLTIGKGDSLYYDMKLRPRLIQTKGVEVLGQRPAAESLRLGALLFPHDSPNTVCLYGTSTSLPIGVLYCDSALYMYTLEPTVVGDEKYIRIWLLYKNLSQTLYDLDPMKCVRLHMKGEKYSYTNLVSDPAVHILKMVDMKMVKNEISASIAAPFRSMAKKQTLMEREGAHFEKLLSLEAILHDPKWNTRADKIGAQWYGPAGGGTLSSDLYNVFIRGVNDGILKRHLVYPDNCVNGYIYVPFPGLNWKASGNLFTDAWEYSYKLEIITPHGSRVIDFTAGGI